MTLIGYLLAFVIKLASLPLIVLGYLASFACAFLYFGWDKANKHQDVLVAIHDKRNRATDGETK